MTKSGLRTFGFPLRQCLRFSSFMGLLLSVLHITVGCILVIFIIQVIQTPPENRDKFNDVYEEFMLYKGNDSLLFILSVSLIALNLIQITSDVLVFSATLTVRKIHGKNLYKEGGRRKLLWLQFLVGITIWAGSLVTFILIFSAGGLILLLACLVTTAIRVYCLFVLHQFIGHQRIKSNDMKQEIN